MPVLLGEDKSIGILKEKLVQGNNPGKTTSFQSLEMGISQILYLT